MVSCIRYLLIAGAMLSFASGKSRIPAKVNPSLGHRQNEMVTLLNSLAEGKWKQYQAFEYSNDYRPPTPSEGDDDIEPNPTTIKISFKDLEVKLLNVTEEGKEKIEVTGMFVREHTDSRLQFEMPQGFSRTYIRTDYGDDYQSIQIWKPNIESVIDGEFSAYDNWINDVTLFNTNGEVYSQKHFHLESKSPAIRNKNNNVFTFEVKLSEKRQPVEDVTLEWRSENPLLIHEGSEIVKSVSGQKFKFTPSIAKCKRIEKFGSFGEEEYSCLKLVLSFERLE